MTDQSPPAYPTTMDELRQYLARSRQNLLAVVEPLTDEQLARLGPEGWSPKDHLAHLAVWERWATGILTGQDKAATLGVPPDLLATDGFDQINEAIRARWAGTPRAEVMALLAASRQELLATLAGLTYDDLMRPYAHYQPASPQNTDPVAYWVAGNSYQHDDEHRPWIESLLVGNERGQ